MCQREPLGPILLVLLTVSIIPGSVHGQQQAPPMQPAQQQQFSQPMMSAPQQGIPMQMLEPNPVQQRLPVDYVNGVLSLKGSMLSKKAFGYGALANQENESPVAGMKYTPQTSEQGLQMQPAAELQPQGQPQEQPQEQQPQPSQQSPQNMVQMNEVKSNRPSQLFPAPHLFQPPFVPLPTAVKPAAEVPEPVPTQEQFELLKQLAEFFSQRQLQQQQLHQDMAFAKSDSKDVCAEETTTAASVPETSAPAESVSVDVKNKAETTTKAAEATTPGPKATCAPSPKAQDVKTTKATTQKPTKATTKKLPCCTKSPNANVISFSLNIQNDDINGSKLLQPSPRRSGRHAIQPDLRISAIANLLKYRAKRAESKAQDQSYKSSIKRRRHEPEHEAPRHRRVLDRSELLEAELKIWPTSFRANRSFSRNV
ncbi:mediator of RNA polymerase II transcription subunit 15 [Drosophila bipectinata]|uniref:mediator of RNA polymerase II transcription subunit 15 n=1 Tax=Drosophila bipectinata TaxID=42026 RepID=UPI001C892B0A|nr:integrator complex subunit 3 homolog isoform X2 [Drosophila bipectinata]